MCELPVAVCQFLTSSLMGKPATLSAGILCACPGDTILTDGSGATGSGLAVPGSRVTGGGGGAGGGVGFAAANCASASGSALRMTRNLRSTR